jgi:PBP1b-binding outer membrane lipoprotein LpoB
MQLDNKKVISYVYVQLNTKIMRNLIFLIAFIVLFSSCRKDNIDTSRNYTSSSIINSSDLHLGGGCVDAEGNLIVFSPPTFEKLSNGVGGFIRQPSFKKFSSNGQLLQEYVLPAIKWDYVQGSHTWDTINGIVQAWDPTVKVTLAMNKQGNIINSNSMNGLISSYSNGSNNGIVQHQRISGISVDADDTLFVLLSPTYNQDRSLKSPPEILKINSDGSTVPFYTFPSYYNYPVGNMWGNGQDYFPSEKPDDIYIGKDGFVYVAMCSAGKTFRISKMGQMEELTNDIPAPVSISTDKFGSIFIVSSPLIDSIDFNTVKPLEVIQITVDKSRKLIYQGTNGGKYRGNMVGGNIPGKWIGFGSTTDINVNAVGDVFLVDPIESKLILIY